MTAIRSRRRKRPQVDLPDEYRAAVAAMAPDPGGWLDRLKTLGLPRGWWNPAAPLHGIPAHPAAGHPPGFAQVDLDGGRYQPHADGRWALIWPVVEGWSAAEVLSPIDLVAVPLTGPAGDAPDLDTFALRLGAADWLNRNGVAGGGAVHLFLSPWAWFAAGCPFDGAVLLNDRGIGDLLDCDVTEVVVHGIDPVPVRDALKRRLWKRMPRFQRAEDRVQRTEGRAA